jgi:hypothetical protein
MGCATCCLTISCRLMVDPRLGNRGDSKVPVCLDIAICQGGREAADHGGFFVVEFDRPRGLGDQMVRVWRRWPRPRENLWPQTMTTAAAVGIAAIAAATQV